ncbi:MAG TPA: hypothetical protein VE422_45260 [Terriglobia bacterium]|nr:hypothetical protein [Terriglobia bacterium]
MAPYSVNPLVYIFPAIVVTALLLYFVYGAIDRMGLETRTSLATVTGKQFNQAGTTYHTTVAGGRTWVQSDKTPESYVVMLNVGDERSVGLVSKELYQSLQANDTVQVKIRRTRITGRLEVVDVRK